MNWGYCGLGVQQEGTFGKVTVQDMLNLRYTLDIQTQVLNVLCVHCSEQSELEVQAGL